MNDLIDLWLAGILTLSKHGEEVVPCVDDSPEKFSVGHAHPWLDLIDPRPSQEGI